MTELVGGEMRREKRDEEPVTRGRSSSLAPPPDTGNTGRVTQHFYTDIYI